MRRFVGTLLSTLAIVAVIEGLQHFAHGQSSMERPSEPPSAQPDISSLAEQVAILRGEVMSIKLRAQQAEASGAEPPPAVASAAMRPVAPEPIDPEVAEADAERHRERYIATIGRSFVNEVTDRTWAPAVTQEIDVVLRSDEIKLIPKAVECRASACRLEVSDDGTGTLKKTLPLALARLGGSLPNTIAHQEQDASGKSSTVLYMFRGGVPADAADVATDE